MITARAGGKGRDGEAMSLTTPSELPLSDYSSGQEVTVLARLPGQRTYSKVRYSSAAACLKESMLMCVAGKAGTRAWQPESRCPQRVD